MASTGNTPSNLPKQRNVKTSSRLREQADSERGLTNQQKPRKQDRNGQRVQKQNELPAQAIRNRAKWDSNDKICDTQSGHDNGMLHYVC